MAINVMIVDDSIVTRQVMQERLSKEYDIEVIALANDPIEAQQKMLKQWPDVIVLDIAMPHMDGITFLKKIMSERPTPIVICSALTEKNANLSMQALAAGAIGIVNKPAIGFRDYVQDSNSDLVTAIRAASIARIGAITRTKTIISTPRPSEPARPTPASRSSFSPLGETMSERMNSPKLNADAILKAPVGNAPITTTAKIIAIGTSTGGTQALEAILPMLKKTSPGIAIVQHMPEKFTASFASRLDGLCEIEVREAKNNDKILPGLALIAPGGKHMLIKRNGTQYYVEVIDGPLVSRHRPSVDVLFRSAASAAGQNAVGYILTGMGDDGAKGLREMFDAGAMTYAQNEESCVVFGMPKEALGLGAAKEVIALEKIADSIGRYR
jgi:two-component system chemotaxis response regulator CheB